MDDARALRAEGLVPWRRALRKARLKILSNGWGIRAAAGLSRLYRFTGLGYLMKRAGVPFGSRLQAYHRLAIQMCRPEPPSTAKEKEEDKSKELALFLGCVAQSAQPQLSKAASRVLERLGYRIRIPDGQCCCGAMHRHSGLPKEANRLLARNAAAFVGLQTVATASACAAELRTHSHLGETQEICRFLSRVQWPQGVLRPLRARVAVHEPCSHRNILRDADAAYDLLRRIPSLEPVSLRENAFCCGAAGTYMLDNPAMSATLLAPKIEHLRHLKAEILVTTNTGCALHLAAGAQDAGLDLEVLHPVELIDRQFAKDGAAGP
jgi:glycolate oxidase iron-sulfur subunit